MKNLRTLSKIKLSMMASLLTASLMTTSSTIAAESVSVNSDWQGAKVVTQQANNKLSVDQNGNKLKPRRELPKFGDVRNVEASDKKMALNSVQSSASQSADHEFWVHDADSYLDEDVDLDGFYRTFTIDFDVDVSYGYADVYAELYVRAPGGDWLLYYTTDVYEIEADLTDRYVVTTELTDGYIPDYYDILIDVWEYGESADYLVTTYSEADDADLFELPLEDSYNDRYYSEPVEHVHSGSSSGVLILSLLGLLALRRYQSNKVVTQSIAKPN